jgi:hypothetical protein
VERGEAFGNGNNRHSLTHVSKKRAISSARLGRIARGGAEWFEIQDQTSLRSCAAAAEPEHRGQSIDEVTHHARLRSDRGADLLLLGRLAHDADVVLSAVLLLLHGPWIPCFTGGASLLGGLAIES